MNERTEILMTTFKPELSIMVYRSEEDKYYLESHSINKSGAVLEGKPLRQETINEIVEMFFSDRKETTNIGGPVPENLMLFTQLPGGDYKMIWWRLPEQRTLHFAAPLRIGTGRAWVPGIIYMVEKQKLSVYAFKGLTKPSEITPLYRPPFHNVSEKGAVCLGNATVKKPLVRSFANTMKYWEDLFWLSEFSHLNGATNPTKSDLGKLWKRLIRSKGKLKWKGLGTELKGMNIQVKQFFK